MENAYPSPQCHIIRHWRTKNNQVELDFVIVEREEDFIGVEVKYSNNVVDLTQILGAFKQISYIHNTQKINKWLLFLVFQNIDAISAVHSRINGLDIPLGTSIIIGNIQPDKELRIFLTLPWLEKS